MLSRIPRSIILISILALCFSMRAAHAEDKWPAIPGAGVTVFAAGDIGECWKGRRHLPGPDITAHIIERGLAVDPEAQVLTLGDNTYPVGLPAEFDNCYGPTWGKFKSVTHPSSGNHEYYTPKANGYYFYFGEAAGTAPGFYYSFDIGNWHLLSLNSNLKGEAWKEELAWVKKDLAQSKARCTLAYWHHPRFSSGGHGNNPEMAPLWDLLQAAHADLVLNGHDHDYERFAPQDKDARRDNAHGIREFVVGTGGAYLTPVFFRKTNSEIVDNDTHGVLKLVLKDTGYEWEFLAEPGKSLKDSGAAHCHE
ncbi:MAG: metallophosphoesterase [Burkholderiaceae bacterium]|nr:metallophosphoesterase [Burkholderiaceae bacterium]